MKKTTIIGVITCVLLSCTKQQHKSIKDSVHPSDVGCKKELREAQADIDNNKLVYCHYSGNIGFWPLRAQKEMDSLLRKFKIDYQNESSPCLVEENRNYHCYCELMQEEIEKKFGHGFTDSLLSVSDSLHVLKNLDKEYYNGSLYGSWDKPALFPGDSKYDEINHDGLQKAFDREIKYPKDYRFSDPENSLTFLQVYFTVDRYGNAKITDHHIEFYDTKTKEKNYNAKHWDYLKSIAFPLIEKTKWTPAKIKGVSVNSKNDIHINLQ